MHPDAAHPRKLTGHRRYPCATPNIMARSMPGSAAIGATASCNILRWLRWFPPAASLAWSGPTP